MNTAVKLNTKVIFGRPNGSKRHGIVVKLNNKTAKVRDENGVVWNVDYNLIENLEEVQSPSNNEPVVYLAYDCFNNLIKEAIVYIYSGLSPENLSHDGELSKPAIVQRRNKLLNQLYHLQSALGSSFTEDQAFAWDKLRRESIIAAKKREINIPDNY